MEKDIKREANYNKNKLFLLDELNQKKFVDKNYFLESIGVDSIIRIPTSDFPYITEKKFYAHFNLNMSNHIPWKIYALPKIVEFWYYNADTGEEKLPLLYFWDGIKWKCISVEERLSYLDITSKHLENALDYIKNVQDLRKHILWRYTKSMQWYTDDQLINLWVSYTLLELI